MTEVQARHTRLLLFNHLRKVEELQLQRQSLAAEIASVASGESLTDNTAGSMRSIAMLGQAITDCNNAQAESVIQLQQAFCLQVCAQMVVIRYT